MRLALDTNVLVYAEGVGDARRRDVASGLVERLAGIDAGAIVSAQVLGKLFRILHGKTGRQATVARESVLGCADAFEAADSTWTAFQAGSDLASGQGFSLWGALILSVGGLLSAAVGGVSGWLHMTRCDCRQPISGSSFAIAGGTARRPGAAMMATRQNG